MVYYRGWSTTYTKLLYLQPTHTTTVRSVGTSLLCECMQVHSMRVPNSCSPSHTDACRKYTGMQQRTASGNQPYVTFHWVYIALAAPALRVCLACALPVPHMCLAAVPQVMLRVSNLDASIKYYTECLGMKLLRTRDNPEYQYTLAFLGYTDEDKGTVGLASGVMSRVL